MEINMLHSADWGFMRCFEMVHVPHTVLIVQHGHIGNTKAYYKVILNVS